MKTWMNIAKRQLHELVKILPFSNDIDLVHKELSISCKNHSIIDTVDVYLMRNPHMEKEINKMITL